MGQIVQPKCSIGKEPSPQSIVRQSVLEENLNWFYFHRFRFVLCDFASMQKTLTNSNGNKKKTNIETKKTKQKWISICRAFHSKGKNTKEKRKNNREQVHFVWMAYNYNMHSKRRMEERQKENEWNSRQWFLFLSLCVHCASASSACTIYCIEIIFVEMEEKKKVSRFGLQPMCSSFRDFTFFAFSLCR